VAAKLLAKAVSRRPAAGGRKQMMMQLPTRGRTSASNGGSVPGIPVTTSQLAGYSLAEVLVCLAVMGLVFAGILTGNTMSSNRAEWSGYSLAAQAQAVQQLELARAATWDTSSSPIIDQTTTLAGTNVNILDIPIASTNYVYVTNITTMSNLTICTNPIITIKMFQVNTVWNWRGRRLFTNSLVTYRAPDQ
jgi:type II secretory pathway pseudopilin PulG